jgi:hypothetical protein
MNPDPAASLPENLAAGRFRLGAGVAFLLGGLIQSGAALAQILNMAAPSEQQAALGLSPARLGLAALFAVVLLGFGILLLWAARYPGRASALGGRLASRLEQPPVWSWLLTLAIAGTLLGAYLLLLTPEISEPFTRGLFQRLLPVFTWLAGMCLQTLLLLAPMRFGPQPRRWLPQGRGAWLAAGLFAALLALWAWIAVTRIGLQRESVGWYDLGAPLLGTQVILAALLSLLAIGVSSLAARLPAAPRRGWPLDLTICLALWLGAALYWQAVPLPESWFVSQPRQPNFEHYPNSDALLYDTTGQSLLVGEGLKTLNERFTRRPFYTAALALFNLLAGFDYDGVIRLQILFLAWFPALVYLLGRRLHSRLAGLLGGVLILLREGNAIQLSDTVTTTHSKMLMADLPMALGAALLAVLAVAWLDARRPRPGLILAAGGVLGLFMLVRPESGIFLGAVGLLALLAWLRQPRRWLQALLLFSLGMGLLLAPWVFRNWQRFGKLFLDSPIFRAELVLQRYNPQPEAANNTMQQGESEEQFIERVAEETGEFVKENPEQVANFILNHYMNSQLQMALMFPAAYRLPDSLVGFLGHRDPARLWYECCSTDGYVRRLPFRENWDGRLPAQSVIPLAVNLFVLAAGLAQAWERRRFSGLLPLALSASYMLVNAVFRNSGGRYILAVDWAGIVYYAIGLSLAVTWLVERLAGRRIPAVWLTAAAEPAEAARPGRALGLAAAAVFLAGCLIPLAEGAIPPRYPPQRQQELLASMLAPGALDESQRQAVQAFLDGGGQALAGRALYPRYFLAGQGEPGSRSSFSPKEFARVGFYLVGPYNTGVLVPAAGRPEAPFPNAVDVLVVGCTGEEYFDALAAAVFTAPDRPPTIFWRAPQPALSCPFLPPG